MWILFLGIRYVFGFGGVAIWLLSLLIGFCCVFLEHVVIEHSFLVKIHQVFLLDVVDCYLIWL
jgi:hypothetical protein